MKLLFISTYPIEVGPSQRFRVGQYLPGLRESGMEVDYCSFYTEDDYQQLFMKGGQLGKAKNLLRAYIQLYSKMPRFKRYDAVVIQRETSPIGPPMIAFILKFIFRTRLVYDFDDAIWLPNYTHENRYFHWLKSYWKTKTFIKWSDAVLAGNEFLANYARQFNEEVHVLPTVVDTEKRYVRKSESHSGQQGTPVIGWTGSISTIQHLEALDSVFHRLRQTHEFSLKVISNKAPNLSIEHEYVQWSIEDEIDQLEAIDIGIMPLPDNQWTKGKCGFKAIQYMAMGIPAIASPVGMNVQLIKHGVNGMLCQDDSDWLDTLATMLGDAEKRNEMGANARKTIEDGYSVSSQLDRMSRLVSGAKCF